MNYTIRPERKEDYYKLKSKEKSHIPEYRGIEDGIQNNTL